MWLQEVVRAGRLQLKKVRGTDNPADVFTKYVDHSTLAKALKVMNVYAETGRTASAPAAAV